MLGKITKILFLLFVQALLVSNPVYALPQFMEKYNNDKFAKESKKNKCSVCHIDPNGGGPRNDFGQAFDKNGREITDDLRKKFPELFNLLKDAKPHIKKITPRVVTVSEEIDLKIQGKNFTEDCVLQVTDQDGNEISDAKTDIVDEKVIEVRIKINVPGKYKLQVICDLGESNTFKIKAKS